MGFDEHMTEPVDPATWNGSWGGLLAASAPRNAVGVATGHD